MSEIEFTETPPAQVDEIPAELPVLPLKETVVFPDSMTPLAIGQERSIQLVDDVVGGERLLALVTVRDADVEAPGWATTSASSSPPAAPSSTATTASG